MADELLRPSVIYAPAVRALLAEVEVHSIAHITGGGIGGNLNRVLSASTDAVVDRSSWTPPRIFAEIQRHGGISDDEMAKVFNLGIGMIVAVDPSAADRALAVLGASGVGAAVVGSVTPGSGAVTLR